MGYRNIGFAPMRQAKADDKSELPAGAIIMGCVPVSMDENARTANLLVKVATSVRDKCAEGGTQVGLGDCAAVFVAQAFAHMGLHVLNQAEYEALVRVFRGFEVAVNRLAVMRNNQN